MSGSSIFLLLSMAAVGAGEDVVPFGRIAGTVVGQDGKPARGANVMAAAGSWDGASTTSIGRATADDEGRFSLDLSDEPSGRDRPTLWAWLPRSVVASRPIDRDLTSGRSARLTLGTPTSSRFVVQGPDGRPIAGASIIPRRVAREVQEVPGALAGLSSATTDRDGSAVISAFRPEELLGVVVEAPGFGSQPREFGPADGMAEPGTKTITLLDAGRVTGRVVADDPGVVGGLSVRVVASGGSRGEDGLAEATTDPSGRFEFPAIAPGMLTVRVRPRDGSPDLPTRVVQRMLRGGLAVEAEVPLRRGVKVTGLAVDAVDGRPVAGVVVSVVPSGPSEPSRVRTDANGRYEAFVPAGLVGYRVLKVPPPYLAPPSFVGPRPVEVPPGIALFELPTIALARGGDLRGSVVDEAGRPVSDARVEARWTMFDGRIRVPISEFVSSKADGSFVLGPVALDAELSVAASRGGSCTVGPIRARISDGGAIVLKVVEPESEVPTGRVVDPDGRPIAGATVRIWGLADSSEGSRLVEFVGVDGLKTDPEGRFRVPRKLGPDRQYRALAWAAGHLPGLTRPIRLDGRDASAFPDIPLAVEPSRVAVEGRVLDRDGRPVRGARVRVSAEGPRGRGTSTDDRGRFRLADVPDARGFLFVEVEGYRFSGRVFDPKSGPFDLTVIRLDEIPALSMTTRPVAPGGMILARGLLAPYVDRVLSEGDHSTRVRAMELFARVDPKRVLAMLDAGRAEDAWYADHLRHAASRGLDGSDADGKSAAVDLIRDAEWRVLGAIDAVDALPESARSLKRGWVERALRDARSIDGSTRKILAMARVADRLIDLGDVDRATRLLAEALPIAGSLPTSGSGGRARVEFAETLARVEPANALALTEDLIDPDVFDRCRLKIARRLAIGDPSRAARVLESLRNPRSLARSLPSLCHALAPADPAMARALLAKANCEDECVASYSLGMMALAISIADKPTATAWLREAFEGLDRIAASGPTSSGASHDPSAVAAALLPVAERIDPKLVPELFWRAISLHDPTPAGEGRRAAVLALLLARYDETIARAFFEPEARRALASPGGDLGSLLAASAILDPGLAVRLVEMLPEPPDLTFHHPKNAARLALAAALARGTTLAVWDDATTRFLQLWSVGSSTGE